MNKNPLVRTTKILLDFMFYSGIIVCVAVPVWFRLLGRYYDVLDKDYIPFCITFMIAGVFAIVILWELRNMFRTVIKGNPFVSENVKSLKIMGVCSFVISICMIVWIILAITLAAFVLVMVFLIAGLFSLVLSQVFDQAVTYKQENDLTI